MAAVIPPPPTRRPPRPSPPARGRDRVRRPARSSDTRRRHGPLLLVLAAALVLGLWPLQARPGAVPADAPASEFSAQRATRHLEVIAAEKRTPWARQRTTRPRPTSSGSSRRWGWKRRCRSAPAPARPPTSPVVPCPRGACGTSSPGCRARTAPEPSCSSATTTRCPPPRRGRPGGERGGRAGDAAGPARRAPLRNDVLVAFVDAEPNGLIGDRPSSPRTPGRARRASSWPSPAPASAARWRCRPPPPRASASWPTSWAPARIRWPTPV